MQRTTMRADYAYLHNTPSKRQKYDNYTPRKRYVKDQEESSSYYPAPGRSSYHTSPQNTQEEHQLVAKTRNATPSNREYSRTGDEPMPASQFRCREMARHDYDQPLPSVPSRSREMPRYEFDQPLEDCTSSILSCRPSLRKQKFIKNVEEREPPKKYGYEDENRDESNWMNRERPGKERGDKVVEQSEPLPMTPRRGQRIKENSDPTLNQKMAALQNKIARLERMTPQKPVTPQKRKTPQVSRGGEDYGYESSAVLFEREGPRAERPDKYERPERKERNERNERNKWNERNERPERTSRPERGGRAERLERADMYERTERMEKPERVDRPEKQVGGGSAWSRESELFSRGSLGRLVEQEEGENEVDVIQDLSYKISCKLQSIIRNFS